MLAPGLRVLLCGSAAGAVSAQRGLPYAGPGNKFWRILHESGLTPELLAPGRFEELAACGVGLTDLCKTASGSDAQLPRDADDVEGLRAKVERHAPGVLAFVGKRAASVALGRRVQFGPQPERFGGAETWVLPSTSGLAAGFWDPAPWHALAQRLAS
ncbi:MAG: mismatch-specific DNA-glycosylase [Solirubrobacteraceae bacterium]